MGTSWERTKSILLSLSLTHSLLSRDSLLFRVTKFKDFSPSSLKNSGHCVLRTVEQNFLTAVAQSLPSRGADELTSDSPWKDQEYQSRAYSTSPSRRSQLLTWLPSGRAPRLEDGDHDDGEDGPHELSRPYGLDGHLVTLSVLSRDSRLFPYPAVATSYYEPATQARRDSVKCQACSVRLNCLLHRASTSAYEARTREQTLFQRAVEPTESSA